MSIIGFVLLLSGSIKARVPDSKLFNINMAFCFVSLVTNLYFICCNSYIANGYIWFIIPWLLYKIIMVVTVVLTLSYYSPNEDSDYQDKIIGFRLITFALCLLFGWTYETFICKVIKIRRREREVKDNVRKQ